MLLPHHSNMVIDLYATSVMTVDDVERLSVSSATSSG